jgi:hypothetical protein
MKLCIKCNIEKHEEEFYIGRNQCKKCINEKCKINYICNVESHKERHRQYNKTNKSILREKRRIYVKNERKSNVLFKLRQNLRRRFSRCIKLKGTEKILGCSFEQFRVHIESKFKPGMSWDNYGYNGWHIDHIMPLSWFDVTDPNEVDKANHYTNLQPLWAKDNFIKNNRYFG